MFGHFNHRMDAAAPAGKPYGVGDYFYAQDLAKDFWYLLSQIGKIKELFTSYPTLVSGGTVALGASAWQVNIDALVALLEYSIQVQDGDVAWAFPPATKNDVIAAILNADAQVNLDVHSGGLLAPTADGVTLNYLWVQYAEAAPANAMRSRMTVPGSYSYELRPAPAFGCGPVAPAGNDKVLLATLTISAAGAITIVSQSTPVSIVNTNGYDLIVDSNAKLDAWCACTTGQYKRVLIKSGTWTASAIGVATAGVMVDLDKAGTNYVFAEPGAEIRYTGGYAGTIYGLYRASILGTRQERYDNVRVYVSNTSTGASVAFNNCQGMFNCIGVGTSNTSTLTGAAFNGCKYLVGCYGQATGNGGPVAAYNQCSFLSNCDGYGATSFTGSAYFGAAYYSCSQLNNCNAYAYTNSAATGYAVGFYNCTGLNNCVGLAHTSSPTGTSVSYGFWNCTAVVGCAGQGTGNSSSAVGYGYIGCHKMQQNRAIAASKTATYNTSYADSASANAVADTAAGGYNS